jgi:hypothetical protein
MPLKLDHVIERVGTAQLTGMDQAHVQIANISAIQRAIKQSILPVQHSTFQTSFNDVMPTARLCRVPAFPNRPAWFPKVADAA